MNMTDFIAVGENIHCTRIVTSGGSRTGKTSDGRDAVAFKYQGERYLLPVPAGWGEISPPYNDGKIRHIALAIHQCLSGKTDDERAIAEKYLCWAADRQVKKGAKFLDVNVDEYTNDTAKRVEIMTWLAGFLSERFDTPLSIDSSNAETLNAGLEQCRKDTAPLVNSVSLEREEAVDVVISYNAEAVVSAAGKSGLPNSVDSRLANFDGIMKILLGKNMKPAKMHLDPLVFPISVDPNNGKSFLDSTRAIRERYPDVNITGGLSNISFGMPNRKLLNMVFTWMFVEAGGNGGIIDTVQMPPADVGALDPDAEAFKLARDVLDGTDMFGGEYIAAFRDGKLS